MVRNLHGIPTLPVNGEPSVVVADAVALLSGVNFSSLVKVFAALEAIKAVSGVTDLTNFAEVPLLRVDPSDSQFSERAERTDAFVKMVARDPGLSPELREALKLAERFQLR